VLLLAQFAAMADPLGDIGPRPTAAGVALEAVQGREKLRNVGGPHAVAAFENGYHRVETSFLIDPSHDAINAIEKQIGMGNVKVLQGV